LDIVVHKNIRICDVNVFEILDSDTLLVLFQRLDHVSTRDISVPVEINTDWERRFQSPASDLISPRIQIHTFQDAEEAASKFAASRASAYRLSTNKITLSELNEELPDRDCFHQLKQRLKKLWQEIRDPACKTAVNWVKKQYAG
jgi:hypothetical protein